MKKIIVIIVIVLPHALFSQVGDAAIVAAVSLGHYVENQNLKKIVENEAEIMALQTVIAQETFVIKELEQKLYKSLSTVQSVIANAQQVLDIAQMGEDIAYYQEQIAITAAQDPQLVIIALEFERHFLRKSADLLTQIFLATIGGDTNLMDNKQRLDLLYRILNDMQELRNQSYVLLKQMRVATWVNVLEAADALTFDWGIDFQQIHDQAMINIQETANLLEP